MTNIWLPMSAGQTHIAKKYVDSHATNDPTVFIVGPEGGRQPVKMPDAPTLDPMQLKDILEWQDEVAHDNYKSRQEKEKELNEIRNKPGYADRVKELKEALSNRAEWEREKKLGEKKLYF